MLLNIRSCAGQTPTTKNYLVQNVLCTEIEKPWSSSFPWPSAKLWFPLIVHGTEPRWALRSIPYAESTLAGFPPREGKGWGTG